MPSVEELRNARIDSDQIWNAPQTEAVPLVPLKTANFVAKM